MPTTIQRSLAITRRVPEASLHSRETQPSAPLRSVPSPPLSSKNLASVRRLSSPFLPSTADTHTSAPLVGALSTPFSQTFFASVCTSSTTILEVCPSPVNHGLNVCCFHQNLNHGHHVLCLHKNLNHGHVFAVSIKF